MDHAGTRARGLTIESRWAWLAVRVVALCFAVVGFSCDPLPPDELHTSVALLDVAREPLDIQIFRPPEALVCSKVAADPESLLTAQDFAFDSCTTLTPFTLAGLDIGSYVQDDYDPPPGIATPRSCDAVVLRAQGLADVVVFWNGVERASIDLDADNPGVDNPNVGYVNNVGAYWFLVPPTVARTWSPDFTLPATDCEAAQ